MKTLFKLANDKNVKQLPIVRDNIYFSGNTAYATNLEQYAYFEGAFNFTVPTLVSISSLKAALAINKKPIWKDDTCNGVKLSNNGEYSPLEYPICSLLDGNSKELLFNGSIADIFKRVTPAMATKDLRYYLNGLCFNLERGDVIATDGHRLHLESSAFAPIDSIHYAEKVSVNGVISEEIKTLTEVIIPRMAFDLGLKIEKVKIAKLYAHITHSTGYLVTKLIDGRFPDYRRVIPDTNNKQIIICNGMQHEAIKKAVAINKAKSSKFGGVKITQGGSLLLDDIEIPFINDRLPFDYGFNAEYISDSMNAADNIDFYLPSDNVNYSAMFKADNFTAVVMPMRI